MQGSEATDSRQCPPSLPSRRGGSSPSLTDPAASHGPASPAASSPPPAGATDGQPRPSHRRSRLLRRLGRWLRDLPPRSLTGRATLILIVPIVALQLVVSLLFIQRHFDRVTRQMTGNILIEVAYLLDRVDAAEDAEAAAIAAQTLAAPLQLDVTLPALVPAPADGLDRRERLDLSGAVVLEVMRAGIPGLVAGDLVSEQRRVRLWIDTAHGLLLLEFPRLRVSATNPHQLLVLMLVSGLLMTVIAVIFLRNQLRPINRLARAADAFGKGRVLPYEPMGAAEVRAAGRAFVDMRARIERQIEQRTLLLSGVSHDLRTPLTRLRLGLSMLPDTAEAQGLLDDVRDMEALVDSFLAFARAEALDETEATDPADLVAQICDQAGAAGGMVVLHTDTAGRLAPLRRIVFARAVENLLSNALRYGTQAVVTVTVEDTQLLVTVEDDGPGIPADRRAEALRPFVRLDRARNQDRGSGVGLGLAIAQDAAISHGGSLELGDSGALGGLRATLSVPC